MYTFWKPLGSPSCAFFPILRIFDFNFAEVISVYEICCNSMGKVGTSYADLEIYRKGKAEALGMKVIYHNRRKLEGKEAEYVGFEELLRRSDVLSLHVPLNVGISHILYLDDLASDFEINGSENGTRWDWIGC